MQVTNYSASAEVTKLLTLNNLLSGTERVHTRISWHQSYFTEDDNTDLLTYLSENTNLFREHQPSELFHISLLTPNVPRGKMKEWKETVTTKLINQGAEFYELLSTAMSTKNSLTLFFKLENVYISTSTAETNMEDMYYNNLACMLQEHSAVKDFVLRATKAIQNKESFQYSPTEEELLREHASKAIVRDIYSAMSVLTTPKRPTERIETVQEAIRSITQDLLAYNKELRELQLKDFAILTGLSDNQDVLKDFKEYLHTITDNILDLEIYKDSPTSGTINLTMKSIIFLPESDKDFIKERVVGTQGHPLYNKPIAFRLMKDIIQQKIRLPITASYIIKYRDNAITSIGGLRDWHTSSRTAGTKDLIVNQHINRFSCFDGYGRMMIESMRDINPIGFFEIMRQCTGTINVFDSAVITRIIPMMEQYKGPLQIKRDTGWENILMEEYLNETTQTE